MIKIISFFVALLYTTLLYANDSIEVVNIQNKAVQAYLADRTYEDPSTSDTTSIISKYNKSKYGDDRDSPAGKVVSWTPTVSSSKIREIDVIVSNDADFADSKIYNPKNVKDSTYTIQNMLPDLTYYYKVEEVQSNDTTTIVASGKFKTIGQIRMICVDSVANVRDLGGWQTSFGVPIKYGKLYRSGKTNYVTKTGVQQFRNVGVGAELDLRSETESELTASPFGDDVDFKIISNDKLYKGLTDSKKRKIFAEDLRWIIEELKNSKPVDFHCKVGCDRTGTLAFLIEGLLGVCRNDIDRDFELSTFSGEYRHRNYDGVGNYPKMWPYLLENYNADELAETFYKYWIDIGMTEDELNYFREEMLGIKIPVADMDNIQPLLNYLLGKGGMAIDANRDGTVNIADLTYIINKILNNKK